MNVCVFGSILVQIQLLTRTCSYIYVRTYLHMVRVGKHTNSTIEGHYRSKRTRAAEREPTNKRLANEVRNIHLLGS